jgi:AraC-like DNA-binding protein
VYRREVGATPQALRRLARFDRSVQALRTTDPGSFAEVAYLCGYVDQPHMINDWQRLAGCTPVTWWRDEVLGRP